MSKQLARDRKTIAASRGKRTTGEQKRFDPASYATHNASGVQAVLSYLDTIDLYATENDDRYGPDIVVWRGLRPAFYIEVAQRTHWKSGDWPEKWNPIHIEERKLHLFRSLSLPCEYWIVRLDGKVALIVTDDAISACDEVVEIPNRLVRSGERFLCIDLVHCIEKDLT